MIRILQFLLDGCWHNWGEPFGRMTDHYDLSFGAKSFMYTTQNCRCKKCGKFGTVKFRGGQS